MELSSLTYQEVVFRKLKMKKHTFKMFLIFREMELFRLNLKRIPLFQERTYRT